MSSNATATMAEILAAAINTHGGKKVTATDVVTGKKSNGNGKKSVFSFASLVKFEAPTVPVIEKLALTEADRAKNATAMAKFKAEIGQQMANAVANIRACEQAEDDEKAAFAAVETQMREFVAKMNALTGVSRAIAMTAYAAEMVATCPRYKGPVIHLLDDLKGKSFIVEADRGVKAYGGRHYLLGDDFKSLTDARAVLTAIGSLIRETVEAGAERIEASVAELTALAGDNPLSAADLKAGKPGRALLYIPKDSYCPGGWMAVESAEGVIYPLGGAGYIQRRVGQLAEAGYAVPVDQIGNDRLELGEKLQREDFNNLLTLFFLIKNGVAYAEKEAAQQARKDSWHAQLYSEYEALEKQATVSMADLPTSVGTAVLYLGSGRFEWSENRESKRYYGVMALVERRDNGDVRIVACPERLKDLFAGYGEWSPAGTEFKACESKLRVILQRAHRLALRSNKADGTATTAAEIVATEAEASPQIEQATTTAQSEPPVDTATEAASLGLTEAETEQVETVVIVAPPPAEKSEVTETAPPRSRYINPRRSQHAAIAARLAAAATE